jgi:hypothetical protein
VGTIASHPFDDTIYAQHAQFFYYLNVNPAFSLPMGLYYDLINVGGYFVTILFSLEGVSNVLTIQIGVKIPLIVFTFLTAYFLYRILDEMGYNGNYAALLLLTSPIYFFTSLIYGSAIVVSVFFTVSSVYFLFRKNSLVSAALFGISVGSYLYPVFSIPFILRYVNKEGGKKEALLYLLVASAFAAIGQLSVMYIYLRLGYYGVSPNNPSGYLSTMPVPYYSVFDIFNILGISSHVPGIIYNYVYYGSATIASFSYFLLKKEKVNKESLLVFFLIQGVLFSAINPYNLPSYVASTLPFALILAIMNRRWVMIGMLWISSLLSFLVMQTINPVGFLIYFSDVNQKILDTKNVFPQWINGVFGFLYSLSLLFFIPVALKMKKGETMRFTKTLLSQGSVIGALAVVALLIVVPVSSNIPSNMYLTGEINTFQAQPVSESLVGSSLLVEYSVPVVGFLSQNELKNFIGYIETPSSFYTIYNTSRDILLPPGTFEQSLRLDYPLRNATLEMYGEGNGSVTPEMVNATSTVIPNTSSELSGKGIYRFTFNGVLCGLYELEVNSSVSLYGSSKNALSLFFGGYPWMGSVMIGKELIYGDYVSGYLLKSDLTLNFTGPFNTIPPFEPSLVVYLVVVQSKPTWNGLIEGGIAFVLLILLPPLLVLFQIKRRGSPKRLGQ